MKCLKNNKPIDILLNTTDIVDYHEAADRINHLINNRRKNYNF